METMLEYAWDEVQNMCDTWVYEALGAEFDRLIAQLAELTTELARYKQGVEVEDFVNRYGVLEAEFELPTHLRGKRVRVLVMKVEE